jgi:hypothetical protein
MGCQRRLGLYIRCDWRLPVQSLGILFSTELLSRLRHRFGQLNSGPHGGQRDVRRDTVELNL